MPNMYDEYLTYYNTYTAKFGSKVAIFLMVGMFYEMYDERSPEGVTKTTVQEVVDLLGLAVSVKKGEGPGGPDYDGIVAGVPDQHIHKWSARLTQQGWTVVLVGQVKNAAGKVTKRQVDRILTPGSHIESASLNSHEMYLTFVSISITSSEAPHIALTAVDLTTGSLHVFETQANGTQDAWTSNDVVQFMELYPPREVLWSIEGPKYITQAFTNEKLQSLLSLNQSNTTFHQRSPLNSGAWLKPAFREEYLRSRCSLKSLLPTHVALHLAAGSRAETALLSLLNALEELWPSMNLGPLLVYPWIPTHCMRLGENALVQLHMIHETKQRLDVLTLFDSCATPMGHRGLRQRLLKPSAHSETIQTNLDAVEAWTKKPAEYCETIYKRMRTMCDIDRVYRKIQQGTVSPTELVSLDISFKALNYITRSENNSMVMAKINDELFKAVFKVFDISKIYNASEDVSLFTEGQVPALDLLETQIKTEMAKIDSWIQERAKSGNVSADSFRIEFRERSLVVKAARGIIQGLKMAGKLPASTTAVMNKSSAYLESTELDQIYLTVGRLRENLKAVQAIALVEKGTALTNMLFTDWIRLTDWITQTDVNLTLARIATNLGYVKPVIETSETGEASVHIEGLRHPLLEAQDRKIPYVQHTVTLDKQGWLLYGLNASGKSSLMRATGLAVLLAQAGSFVPASKMVIRPFQSIHTRIINTDNLWMGLSSFAVEMSEMRDIFREAGPKSLVLGDELCSGTETTSATALVAAGIKGLLNRKAKFLFATHLHGLSQIPEVSADPNLKIWHLHVEYDRISDKLIYHRHLKPGSGSSLYGLEVAKAMRIPADILEDAVKFRRRLTGEAELSESVGSAWNQSVIRRKCQRCGATEAGDLEVHHIRERHMANAAGRLADGSSVHSAANLMVLCDGCHDEIHRENLVVQPAIQTSDGIEDASTVVTAHTGLSPRSSVAKSKWSEEELTTIKSVISGFGKLSDTNMSKYILSTHGITISGASLKKMRQEL
jgi:DNA mismatch repair protein MutS